MIVLHNVQLTKRSIAIVPYLALIFDKFTANNKLTLTFGFLNFRFDLVFISTTIKESI